MRTVNIARAHVGVRRLLGAGFLAGVVALGAGPSFAQDAGRGRAPAPIIYASAQPAPTLPNSALNNSVSGLASRPLADTPEPRLSFDAFEGRQPASAPASGAIDLRGAGAVRASYSPPAQLRPAAAEPTALAEPYAGAPYQVDGKWYVPTHEPAYNEVGIASWYGPNFHGKLSASGEPYDMMSMTAAHPTLPIPSIVRVTNLENGKTALVRLNDRGPFVDDRIIDLSRRAAETLDMTRKGTAKVRVEYVGPAPAAPNTLPPPASFALASLEQPARQPAPIMTAAPAALLISAQAPVSQPQRAPITAAPLQATRGYFVQAGSFADLANADKLRNSLRALGPVSVSAATVNGTEYYRVMLGPWSSRAEAEQMQRKVIASGANGFVVARLND